jgi:hypothetical protein
MEKVKIFGVSVVVVLHFLCFLGWYFLLASPEVAGQTKYELEFTEPVVIWSETADFGYELIWQGHGRAVVKIGEDEEMRFRVFYPNREDKNGCIEYTRHILRSREEKKVRLAQDEIPKAD